MTAMYLVFECLEAHRLIDPLTARWYICFLLNQGQTIILAFLAVHFTAYTSFWELSLSRTSRVTLWDLSLHLAALCLCRCMWVFSSHGALTYFSGFSCCTAQASGVVARGLSSCSSQALEHVLSHCGAQPWLLHSIWNLPRLGMEPMSHALTGVFLPTAPPGKSSVSFLSLPSCSCGIFPVCISLHTAFF